MNINEFDFSLPKELIAQSPANPRGTSRLLHFDYYQQIHDRSFKDVIDLLNPSDVLVFNDTKVIPSFLKILTIDSQTANASLNLVHQISDTKWQVMAKPAYKLKIGSNITFAEDNSLRATVIEKDTTKNYTAINFHGSSQEVFKKILKLGIMPLPPYIKRNHKKIDDFINYQTIFSRNYGAVAAPTAGLHFTQALLDKLIQKGINIQFLTLHVGLGTFAPITAIDINEHRMHVEKFVLSASTCEAINNAKANGNQVVCVGTTTMRVLESVANKGKLKPTSGNTNIFIKPGHKFQIVDALITNFHLPKSTLLILVSAFIGHQNAKNVYCYAIKHKYRFFSYGDACYLQPKHH